MIYNYNVRPYIVINGISSKLIKGLIITKLPPVTRAAQRTLKEEVDGRDGDLITPLGFAAYDKTLEIGLANDFDIDAVISYLSQSGKIVFSNEPDKYYKFSSFNAIDFQKLLRFKKASVTFHVQPFKFSDNEGELSFTDLETGAKVRNNGNYFSRPVLTIEGAGELVLEINGEPLLELSLDLQGQTIIIDCNELEAYNYNRKILLNRLVSGNYDDVRLKAGDNLITFSGAGIASSLKVENFSRWL